MPRFAPSLLSSDLAMLSDAVSMMEKAGVSIIHFDIMDGRFVPPITFGAPVVKCLRKHTKLQFDCHLMVVEPENQVQQFVDAGADYITIHIETTNHPNRLLSKIKKSGCKSGIALNPATPIETLTKPIFEASDLILLMSVNPGFGGQEYIESTTDKIKELRSIIDNDGYQIEIAVDGGICKENIKIVAKAGADMLIAGSTIFHSPDPIKEAINLRSIIEK
jgi:ribulose-phosphate 3-epimerase